MGRTAEKLLPNGHPQAVQALSNDAMVILAYHKFPMKSIYILGQKF
ncbi:hypothetical protein [Legionella londiniensis]|nr:hypothetical protein [Legionella londiniensis]STX92262.1 Uncharacterised protein [Legionella londiniensis]